MSITVRLFLLLLFLVGICPASAQDTLRFTPTVGYPTFDVREPVATIRPGTVIISETNKGAYYERGGGKDERIAAASEAGETPQRRMQHSGRGIRRR